MIVSDQSFLTTKQVSQTVITDGWPNGIYTIKAKYGAYDSQDIEFVKSDSVGQSVPVPASSSILPDTSINQTETIKQNNILSPLKQFKSGLLNIKCKEGHILMIKTENNSPACVTVSTEGKLIQWGWGVSAKINVSMWHVTLQNGSTNKTNP